MADEQNDPHEGITLEDASLKEREVPQPDPVEEPKPEPVDAKAEEKPEAEPEKPKADPLPIGVQKRLAKADRRVDEMTEKLAQAQAMIDALKAKKEGKKVEVDPNEFDDYEKYAAAVKEKAEPDAPPVPDREVQEAVADLKEVLAVADPDLWAKFQEVKDGKAVINNVSRAMVIELADIAAEGGDIAGKMRALAALSDDERAEIAGMTNRGVRRALRDLTAKAEPEKPAQLKDPTTGRFVKASEAPEPISPVGSGSAPQRALDKLGFEDFKSRRDEAEKSRSQRFGFA